MELGSNPQEEILDPYSTLNQKPNQDPTLKKKILIHIRPKKNLSISDPQSRIQSEIFLPHYLIITTID